jgi:DUF971 family protein
LPYFKCETNLAGRTGLFSGPYHGWRTGIALLVLTPRCGYNACPNSEANYSMKVIPTLIKLHNRSRFLELEFEDGKHFKLSCEYLRVFSPSAEVKGHGPGQEVLQVGKENVNIIAIEPIGTYAVRLVFDDSHNSGIYSWDVLYDLGTKHKQNWLDYEQRLRDAGFERKPQPHDGLALN